MCDGSAVLPAVAAAVAAVAAVACVIFLFRWLPKNKLHQHPYFFIIVIFHWLWSTCCSVLSKSPIDDVVLQVSTVKVNTHTWKMLSSSCATTRLVVFWIAALQSSILHSVFGNDRGLKCGLPCTQAVIHIIIYTSCTVDFPDSHSCTTLSWLIWWLLCRHVFC